MQILSIDVRALVPETAGYRARRPQHGVESGHKRHWSREAGMAYPQSSSSQVLGLQAGSLPSWLDSDAAHAVQHAEGLAFEEAEYEARLARVRDRMQDAEIDALMLFRPSSIEYLCGFHTAETASQPLLVTESETFLYVPDLEVGRALASSRVDTILYCGYSEALAGLQQFIEHAAQRVCAGARVGIDLGHTSTPPQVLRLWARRGVEIVDSGHLVERVRLVLSPAEIRCLEEAALVTEAGVSAAVVAATDPQATDSSVAGAVAATLYERADSMSAWGPLVVTGRRSGIPHSNWDGSALARGPTFVEFSGTSHRYHAPVMRTLVRGARETTDARLVDLARTTVGAVLESARPGVLGSEVAARAAEALGPLPEDVMFHRLFGYPVGLAHKPHWMDGAPFYLAERNHEPLQEGMAFHVPAAFRAFGRQCVGLSHTFIVERRGSRVITHGLADLIQVEV